MTETTKTEKEKDFAARLADAGGEAMQKLSDLPMGKALVDGAQQLRERLDELGDANPGDRPAREAHHGARAAAGGAREEVEARAKRKPAKKSTAKKPAAKKPAS